MTRSRARPNQVGDHHGITVRPIPHQQAARLQRKPGVCFATHLLDETSGDPCFDFRQPRQRGQSASLDMWVVFQVGAMGSLVGARSERAA